MQKIKQLLLLTMAILLFSATPVLAAETQTTELTEEEKTAIDAKSGMINTDDFVINLSCGIEGNYRYGASMPVNVQIESKNEDFQGLVRIVIPSNGDYGSESIAVEKEVLLTAGTPSTVSMTVDMSSVVSIVYFQLENSKGKIVIDQSIKMNRRIGDSALVGILSDDYAALGYFDKAAINGSYTGEAQLVELSEKNVPEQATGLEAISYIIINSYDTSKLSEGQLKAIKDWVKAGGVLILGLGPDYNRTLSAIDEELVSGNINGTRAGEINLNPLQMASENNATPLKFTDKDGVLDLSVKDANSLKELVMETGYVWDHTYNRGHVIVTAFNLGLEPVSSWNSADLFAEQLLTLSQIGYSATRISNINYGNSEDIWSMSSLLKGLRLAKSPRILVIVILLVVFIFAAPVIYALLKHLDKRGLMWGIIPGLSIIFTVLIFVTNSDIRIKNPLTTSITVVYDDGSTVEQKTYLSYLIPSVSKTNVEMNSDISEFRILTGTDRDYYYNPTSENNKKDYETALKETAEGYSLTFKKNSTFDTSYASFQDLTQRDLGNGIMLDISKTVDGIDGTVTNTTPYDLKGVAVFYAGNRIMVGDVNAGESVPVNHQDATYNDSESMYDLAIPGDFENDTLRAEAREALKMIYESYISYDFDKELNENNVFVAGYCPEWEADYIRDNKISETNRAMFLKKVSVGYADYKDALAIGIDKIAQYSDKWDLNDGQLYATDVELEADISSYFTHVYALVRTDRDNIKYSNINSSDTEVYIWNYKANKYEKMFKDDMIFKISDESVYVKNSIIKIALKCPVPNEGHAPAISVLGGEE